MDAKNPAFPFYLVRAAAVGGGVVSMHWNRRRAEMKRDHINKQARGMEVFVVDQGDYAKLPLASSAKTKFLPARKDR